MSSEIKKITLQRLNREMFSDGWSGKRILCLYVYIVDGDHGREKVMKAEGDHQEGSGGDRGEHWLRVRIQCSVCENATAKPISLYAS